MWRGMDGPIESSFAIGVFEDVNHATIAAADEEVFAVLAKDDPVEDFGQGDKLPLATGIQRDDIDAFFIVSGANGDHRFAVGRDHHLERHIADPHMRAGRGQPEAIEEQVSARKEMLPDANVGVVYVLGLKASGGFSRARTDWRE